jgi:hypothetical protein
MAPFPLQAWQSWKSAKATAFLVVVAFTAGIGSATAIYAVIHSLLLKPLPYAHGERFVSVLGGSLDDPGSMAALTIGDVLVYQQRMRSFDVFGWMQFTNYNLTAPGQPQYLNGVRVTPGLANNLGVNPTMGRWFRDLAGGPVAVLSNGLWQRLGSDAAIVGKTITLSGRIYTVTGVMPPRIQSAVGGSLRRNPGRRLGPARSARRGTESWRSLQLLLRPAATGGHGCPGGRGSEARRQRNRQPGTGLSPKLHSPRG